MSRSESLRLVLGGSPLESVEAIRGYRVADAWTHEPSEDGADAWVRYPLFDGTRLEDGAAYTPSEYDREELGHLRYDADEPVWEVWHGDDLIGSERLLDRAKRWLDETLRVDGWWLA